MGVGIFSSFIFLKDSISACVETFWLSLIAVAIMAESSSF